MNLELDQQERMHSILNKGIDSLKGSFQNSLSSQSRSKSPFDDSSNSKLEHPKEMFSELSQLQNKLSRLENMIQKRTRNLNRPRRSRSSARKSPSNNSKKTTPSRGSSVSSSKKNLRNGSISKKTYNSGQSLEYQVESQRRLIDKLQKENRELKRKLKQQENQSRLYQEYTELLESYERSEAVRKKQKVIIDQLRAVGSGEKTRLDAKPPVSSKITKKKIRKNI